MTKGILVRIDDRLVHAQVVESWLPRLKAEVVLVASKAAAADETQVSLMRLALPQGVALEVQAPARAAARLKALEDEGKKVLVLVPGPREALALLEGGARFTAVNVAGLHYTAFRLQFGKVVFLSDEDREAFKALKGRGVALEGQPTPSEPKTDLGELL